MVSYHEVLLTKDYKLTTSVQLKVLAKLAAGKSEAENGFPTLKTLNIANSPIKDSHNVIPTPRLKLAFKILDASKKLIASKATSVSSTTTSFTPRRKLGP
jgi:hypothetical protein